jgi:hypothetical protein
MGSFFVCSGADNMEISQTSDPQSNPTQQRVTEEMMMQVGADVCQLHLIGE